MFLLLLLPLLQLPLLLQRLANTMWDKWFARTTCPSWCFHYYCYYCYYCYCFHYCNYCYYCNV